MFDRTSRVVLGVVGAFALGVIAGAQLDRPSTPSMSQSLEAAPAAASAPAPATPPSRARAVRLERVPPATAPAVQQHVKRLLNAGTNPEMAAEGFGNARELMTVAYAARNTDIPFVLLKHRVLRERMSLASAMTTL